MTGPCLVLDLNPTWSLLSNAYLTSPTRLIGPFDQYLVLLVDLFKVTHNDTSEEEVLVDNYINGSYLQLTPSDQEQARLAVQTGLDVIVTLAHIWTQYPGQARRCVLDLPSRTLLIEFGGDCGQA